MTPVRGNGSMSVPSYSSRCHSPTSDHSNVTYQVRACVCEYVCMHSCVCVRGNHSKSASYQGV